jgi:hypothetical protein
LAKDVVYFSQGDGREAFEGCDEDVHWPQMRQLLFSLVSCFFLCKTVKITTNVIGGFVLHN